MQTFCKRNCISLLQVLFDIITRKTVQGSSRLLENSEAWPQLDLAVTEIQILRLISQKAVRVWLRFNI